MPIYRVINICTYIVKQLWKQLKTLVYRYINIIEPNDQLYQNMCDYDTFRLSNLFYNSDGQTIRPTQTIKAKQYLTSHLMVDDNVI